MEKERNGIPLTPYWPGVSGLVSVLTFAIVMSLSSAMECKIMFYMGHQIAQKSTSTHSDSEITIENSNLTLPDLAHCIPY